MLLRLLIIVACIHLASGWFMSGICEGPPSIFWPRRCWSLAAAKLRHQQCCTDMEPGSNCFGINAPFTNSWGVLPECPKDRRILFKLFTRNNRATPDFLEARSTSSVCASHFVPNGKVAFIIHGFTDSSDADWVLNLTSKLLVKVPNVIAVDWSRGARGPKFMYLQATANTRVVGAQIATMIRTLMSANVGLNYSNIHLIGHSLGAHVAGYAGKNLTSPKIGRISGLDPAAPNFENYDNRVKLSPSDAVFVDIIHTSIHNLTEGGLGTQKDCGHVDFWPNYLEDMPGCQNMTSTVPFIRNFEVGSCNHARATAYFIASVNDNSFRARSCNETSHDYNYMGYHANNQSLGRFCPRTGAIYPYHRPYVHMRSLSVLIR